MKTLSSSTQKKHIQSDSKNVTFHDFFALHKNEVVRSYDHVSDKGFEKIEGVIGNMVLPDILSMHIMEVMSSLRESFTDGTTRKYFYTLKRLFLLAKENKLIEDDPFRYIKLPKIMANKRNTKILENQRKEIMVLIESSPMKPLIHLMSITGMSCNSCRCLYWDDIDTANDVVKARYTISDREGNPEARYLLPASKQRDIHIPPFIMKSLMELYSAQVRILRSKKMKSTWHRPIFTRPDGKLYTYKNVATEIRKIGEAVGIENLSCRDISEDSTYQAVLMGVPLKDIMGFYNISDNNPKLLELYKETDGQKKIKEAEEYYEKSVWNN